jgi:hypothetical protein
VHCAVIWHIVHNHNTVGRQVGNDLVCDPSRKIVIVHLPVVSPVVLFALYANWAPGWKPSFDPMWTTKSLLLLLTVCITPRIPGPYQHFRKVKLLSTQVSSINKIFFNFSLAWCILIKYLHRQSMISRLSTSTFLLLTERFRAKPISCKTRIRTSFCHGNSIFLFYCNKQFPHTGNNFLPM